MPGAHKKECSHFWPRIAGGKISDTRAFLISAFKMAVCIIESDIEHNIQNSQTMKCYEMCCPGQKDCSPDPVRGQRFHGAQKTPKKSNEKVTLGVDLKGARK